MGCWIHFVDNSFRSVVWAQEPQKPLTLEESIKIALERSLTLHSAVVGIVGSEFRRKEADHQFPSLMDGAIRLYPI